MAIAERHLAARFNRPGHEIVDHFTYVIAGDGDLMEGVAHEAASLAGHLRLGKLVCLYDDNRISLDGADRPGVHARTSARRFEALRLARAARRRTATTSTALDARDRGGAGGRGPAVARDRAHADRLRQPEAGHVRRPRLAARRGAGGRDQAEARLARRASRSSSREDALAHLRRLRRARRGAPQAEWQARFDGVRAGRARRWRPSSERVATRRAAAPAGTRTSRPSRRPTSRWRRAPPAARC